MTEYSDYFWNSLMHYQNAETPFADAYARFGIGFEPRKTGPAFLYPRGTQPPNHENPFVQPLMQMWAVDSHQRFAVRPEQFLSLPWAAQEKANLELSDGSLCIKTCYVFEDAGTFVFEVELSTDATVLSPTIYWSGCLQEDVNSSRNFKFYAGTRAHPRKSFMETSQDGSLWFGWNQPAEENDLPQIGCCLEANLPIDISFASSAYSDDATDNFGPDRRFFRIALKNPIKITPEAPVRICFRLQVVQETADLPLLPPAKSGEIPSAFDSIESAKRRFHNEINLGANSLVELCPFSRAKIAEARFHLLRNGFKGGNGQWKDKRGILCSASRNFSVVFFWDCLFSSVALARFNKDYAKDVLETAFVDMDDRDGATPESKFNFGVSAKTLIHSPQSPIGAWALKEFMDLHGEHESAANLYPVLARNHRYWESYCDADNDGLCEYRWSGQVADNSPLWDDLAVDLKAGYNWIPPVASVPLNSFLYKDAMHLAEIATRLGRFSEATEWINKASTRADRLLEVCYVPEEKCFWDYNQLTRRHTKVKTFYMFWPLFAGMPVPEEARTHLIEKVLLDPRQFFGDVPFPSVAYDEAAYNPVGYWRGRAWPHISYWLIETLFQHGYEREAEAATRRILSRETETKGFTENTVSLATVYGRDGFTGYNWGAAAAHLLHARSYKKTL